MTTLTQANLLPFTTLPGTTLIEVLSGYSPAIVDVSRSQSCVSQFVRTLTTALSFLSLKSTQSEPVPSEDWFAFEEGVDFARRAGVGLVVTDAGIAAALFEFSVVLVEASVVVPERVELERVKINAPMVKPTTSANKTSAATAHGDLRRGEGRVPETMGGVAWTGELEGTS